MSGIYIKGMEMPKRDVTFLVHVNGNTIDITPPRKYAEEYHREKTFYKLIPVPDHGRLIDADAIPYNKIMLMDDDFYYGVTKPYIDRMPTIIEADEEDKNEKLP